MLAATTMRRFLRSSLALCAVLAWNGEALAYLDNNNITVLNSLTQAIFQGAAGSARPLQWNTGPNEIWNISIDESNDQILGINGYNPSTGNYVGTALLFDTNIGNDPFISRRWNEVGTVSSSIIAAGAVLGFTETYTNTSSNDVQGKKLGYFSNGNGNGFDIADVEIGTWTAATYPNSFTGAQLDWRVAISPTIAGGLWSLTGEELDMVNRGSDHGYFIGAGQGNAVVGMFLVPEAKVFGQGGNTFNADVGMLLTHSSSTNLVSGDFNRWYHGYECAQNSTVPSFGQCITANGDVTATPALNPGSPFAVYNGWNDGIDTASATFLYNTAFRAGAGQKIGISDGSITDAAVTSGGGGTGYGISATGTLTWAGTGQSACATNPVINVTTDGSGAISTINSVTTAGSCKELPTPYATTWTAGGGLSAGAGAQITLTFSFAGLSSVGAGTSLGTAIVATGKQFFLQFPGFNVMSIGASNTQITAVSGDIIIGLGAANVTTATHTFLSPPFTNGVPTGVPAQNTIPNMQWNDTSGTINVWSPHTGTWLHVTLGPGAA